SSDVCSSDLDQARSIVRYRVRYGMREIGGDGDVVRERPVDGWSGEEAHVAAQVVPPRLAFATASARDSRLQGDPLTDAQRIDLRPDRDDPAACLVAKN